LPARNRKLMEETTQQQSTELSYYQQRCAAIGLTPELNKLIVKKSPGIPNSKEVWEFPLLCEDDKQPEGTRDILIPLYDIKGEPATYYRDNPGKLQNGKSKLFEVRRYHPDTYQKMCDAAEKEGKAKPGKYMTPKGAKTLPWISPNIIEAFFKKEAITTIVITEGYIKGISGYLNGLYIFALSGIQNYKDKDTGTLHPDILAVINQCQVKNIVLLYDGDCNMISLKALSENKDLYKRPAGFYYSALGIREALKDYIDKGSIDLYFSHVNTHELESEKHPKGLDDLYEAFPNEKAEITKELTTLSKKKPYYFNRILITASVHKVREHLHISTADTFYTYHQPQLTDKVFIFNGSKHQWDADKKILKIVVPAAAKNYFRVGDDYYEKIFVPNEIGKLEYRFVKRAKSTITDDHGKKIIEHIPKYKAFCVKPDHTNYQEVIDNCFNAYKPFEHEPSGDKDCPVTLKFLKHIFGEQYELGLDYIQILYQRPTEKLPILSLVSKENKTGKSTFNDFLKAIFTGNMAIIGNDQLENKFNASWADKLIVACEESFIEKKKTVEKIKALSTGKRIEMERKGIDGDEIAFFAKFILNSNNETNFTIANENDERYWVRRVPPVTESNPNLLDDLIEEIPNFLCYMDNRPLSVPKKEDRMWFAFEKIKTDAFLKLVEANKSGAERELTSILKNLFWDTGFWQLQFTLKYVCETLLRNKYERNYIERMLKEKFKIETTTTTTRFKFPEIATRHQNNTSEEYVQLKDAIGKPYTFSAGKLLHLEDQKHFVLSIEAKQIGQDKLIPEFVTIEGEDKKQSTITPGTDIINNEKAELPF